MKFPRIVHQIWMQGEAEMPDFAVESMGTWKEKNPGFEYMFWDEEAISRLIEQDYAWFYETWKGFPHMVQRVDTGRYAILHRYGGIAADMDSYCLNSVEPLMSKFDGTEKTVLVSEFPFQNPVEHILQQSFNFGKKLINNGIQVAKPGNRIHLALLHTSKERGDSVRGGKIDPGSKAQEVGQVGGLAMAKNVMQFDEYRDELEILPYYAFEAQEAPQKTREKGEGVYSEHVWKASWLPVWLQKLLEKTGPKSLKYTLAASLPLLLVGLFFLLKRFFGNTIASFVMLGVILQFIVLFSLSAHGAYVSDTGPGCAPLKDRLFDLIPPLKKGVGSWEFTVIYEFPQFLLAAVLIWALFFYNGGDRKLFTAIFVSFLIIQALRQFTVQVTALPAPADLSKQRLDLTSIQESFKKKDTEAYIKGQTDMVFSGHTITTVLSLLFFFYMLGKLDCWRYRVLIAVLTAIAITGFAAIRLHYSVDMFVGVVIALLVFGYARQFYEDRDCVSLAGSRFFLIFKLSLAAAFASTCITLVSID